jgi:inner membrane protein
MDPLTHTLVGANLSATRLGDKTRFAAAALVVGANLPDVDGVCYLMDGDIALGFRRGWTHGILALVVLPFVLTGILMLIDRLRPGERPVDSRWLLLLSTIAVWTHPSLDWLNTYGMRWLMPFSGTWFYGDAVFIMDVWLWLALGVGYLAGRRATPGVLITGGIIGAWIVQAVGRRAPEYLPLLLFITLMFVLALLWKSPVKQPRLSQRLSAGALTLAFTYIAVRIALNLATESTVARDLSSKGEHVIDVMAGPHPIDPMHWSIVARTGDLYRYGDFDWRTRRLTLTGTTVEAARNSEEWRRATQDPSVKGLVTWLRYPAYEIERQGGTTLVKIFDARRMGGWARATVALTD